MWPQIEKDLELLLFQGHFPVLNAVPAYAALHTGGKINLAKCALLAKEVVRNSDLQSGIREKGMKTSVRVEKWSKPLLRGVGPGNNPHGSWWFDAQLLERWKVNIPPGTPSRKQKILESIRPMLALPREWNQFTDLQEWNLTGPVPAIVGQGMHQPINPPSKKNPAAQKLHQASANVVFIGGYPQVFVPIVNPQMTRPYVF